MSRERLTLIERSTANEIKSLEYPSQLDIGNQKEVGLKAEPCWYTQFRTTPTEVALTVEISRNTTSKPKN